MKTIKISTCLGVMLIIFSTTMSLLACTTEIGNKLQQTNTSETIKEKTEQSITNANTTSMVMTETTMTTTTNTQNTTTYSTATSQTASNTTAASVATTTKAISNVFIPTVGSEISNWIIPYDYNKWTILQFDYDVIHKQGNDYHFLWILTVKNKTEADLDLTVYIIHWGYHHLIGYVSKTPFSLKAGEIKSLSGEDILGEVFYEEMIYLEDIQIAVYIVDE